MALRGCRWIVAGLMLLGAGGCWDRIDINQLAVVLVLSIDRSPSGDIALGAQIVIPADSGIGGLTGGSGTTGARAVYTVNGVGRTLPAALGNVQSKVPRRLFLGNMQALA
ncbi:MAG TPA: hypothetical protein VFK80_04935, partial [Limnochordia bacterium]|nr:hypothetical protein [Limnochordia bacterium]